ncbi:MAG: sugar kinase [Pseudomonadota bacterium]
MTALLDLLCLGEPMREFNRRPDGLWQAGFGGDVSNVAVAAARQGARAGMLSRLGADAFGADIRAMWAENGVDASAVVEDPGRPTAVYFVDHGPEGHRFSYRRAGSAAAGLTPAMLPSEAVRGAARLHLSGISLAISDGAADAGFAAMEAAREAGRPASLDPNYRPALWPLSRARSVIHGAMALADVALPGLDDARLLTGREDPEAVADVYLEMGPTVVALTLGGDGVLVATPERRERLPAHQVEAVDATGAGDAFDGAFLARLAAGDDPFAAARHAKCSDHLAKARESGNR